jgi:hypothetical protein
MIMVMQPAVGVDSSDISHNSLELHSNIMVKNYTILPESNFSMNGTNYIIVKVNYTTSFLSGDYILSQPTSKSVINSSNYFSIENNYTIQTKVVEHYSYVRELKYIKNMNFSEIGVLRSSINNFSYIADPVANYSDQILGIINEIYNTRVTYDSINITLLQVLEKVDPQLATAIEVLKSTSQTIYDLSQPVAYYGSEIINILNKIEPELHEVVNGSSLPNSYMNSNLLKLSIDTVNYRNDSSKVYDLINNYLIKVQNFLSSPETDVNVGNLLSLLTSLDSTSSVIIQEIHGLIAYPFNSISGSTDNVSRQSNEAVSTQNMTFNATYNSLKFEAAVPYLLEYLQFFIVSAGIIFIILIFLRKLRKHNSNANDNKSKISSNLLALGITNFGATISMLSLLYLFGFIPSFNILYRFFPLYDGVYLKQSTASVISQSGSINSLPITWIFFLIFSLLGALIFVWFSILSYKYLSKSLQIYKTEIDTTKKKIKAPVSTFIPGFLVLMGILLTIIFIENPKIFPDSLTLFVTFILFGYFVFSIIFPFGIMSIGRRVRNLGNFAKNSVIKLAGIFYTVGIMLIYVVVLYIGFYIIYAIAQKNFPNLNIYIYIMADFLFYLGIVFLLLAPIALIYGSRALNHTKAEIP